MTTEPSATPSDSGNTGELASRLNRFLGALIDGIVVAILAVPVMVILFCSGIFLIPVVGTILLSVLGFLISWGVFTALNYLSLKSGQTIGKRVVNTKIVSRDGNPVDVNDLILKRYLPMYAPMAIPNFLLIGSALGMLLMLANFLCIFRDNHACFHDDLAQTKVIQL